MFKLIKIILVTNIVCFSFFANAQRGKMGVRTFYIIRHAEKDTGNNPVLSGAGLIRSGDLYRVLKNKHIDKIYTTKYRRTQMTADSLRIYSAIDTVLYTADTSGNGLAEKIKEQQGRQKNILIIAHSNTIPFIIKKLGIKNFILKEIPETEFDNLYIITKRKNSAAIQYKKYGAASNKNNGANKMKPLE